MANPNDTLPYPENTRDREESLLGAIAGLNAVPDYPVKTMTRKEMYLKYIAEHRGGEGKVEIALTGDSGTLTAEQIALIKSNTTDAVLVNNGRVFYLADKLSTLTYRTYLSLDVAESEAVTAKAIYVQLNEGAVNYGRWTLEDESIGGTPSASDLDDVIDGTGDIVVDLDATDNTLLIGTHAKTVTITDVPPTAEQGTLTEQQLAALEESINSIIVFNNEIYRLNDNGHEAGTRGYSHIGVENGVFMIKNITVTLNTRGWVLTTKELN